MVAQVKKYVAVALLSLLSILLLGSVSPVAVFADESASPSLTANSASAKAGESFDLDVCIANNPGILGATVEVNYDSRLTLTGITNGGAFEKLDMTKPKELTSGCRIHWDAMDIADEYVKDGTVVTLTFAVSESAKAGDSCFVRVVGVSNGGQMDVYDRNLNPVNLSPASCTVTVEAEPPVPVTGVVLNHEELTLTEVGQTRLLEATVAPEDADDRSVTWASTSDAVATVDANGLVTAVAEGEADITVTTTDGNYVATCRVTVSLPIPSVPVTGVALDRSSIAFTALGERVQLQAVVAPEDATERAVRWSSSNEECATVSNDGLVTAIGNGTAVVTASTVDGGYIAMCDVKVDVPKPKASLAGALVSVASVTYTGKALEPKTTVTLDGVVLTEGADYALSYADNVNAGTATVTVTGIGAYEGTATARFQIAKAAQTVTATDKTVDAGKSVALGAKSSDAGKLSYRTSNAAVATVDARGTVTGRSAGTATITVTAAATANHGAASKAVAVTVVGDNTLVAKAKKKTVSVKASKVRKKAYKAASNVGVSGAQGGLSYANASTSKKAKKFKVNAKNGKVTVPKGTKKGTYKLKVRVTAAGDATHRAASKVVSYTVKVK